MRPAVQQPLSLCMTPTHATHIHTDVCEVERVSENQTLFRSEIHIDQVCLYKPEDSSTLHQEMLTYKASQVSFHLISPHELHSDDSDWEYLGCDIIPATQPLLYPMRILIELHTPTCVQKLCNRLMQFKWMQISLQGSDEGSW